MEEGINKEDIISDGATQSLEQLNALLAQVQKELLDIINAGNGFDKTIKNATRISKLTSIIKSLSSSIDKLQAAQAKLDAAQSKLSSSTSKGTSSSNQNASAKNKEASANDKLSASATKAAGSNNKLASSSSKLLGSIKRLLGVYISLNAALNLFNNIVGNTAKLDSLNFTLKAVIQNTFELAQTHIFLADTINKFGLDLEDTTSSYARFRAAVSLSNITVKQGQQIFESIAKASAVLGLSQEKTNDVFLALEQMLSKGTVMTEELRRQMGQHLPVAMAAMAAAAKDAGVSTSGTTAELSKLMKQGKIISEDVLPYFAQEVEKALGIEQVKTVDNLVAAQERLSIAWMNFVKALEATPGLTAAYNKITGFVSSVTNLIKSDTAKIEEGADSIIYGVNEELNKGLKTEEKKAILTEQLNNLLKKREELEGNVTEQSQLQTVAYDKSTKLSKLMTAMARNTWRLIGGSTERFDATFGDKPSKGIEKTNLQLASVDQAIDKIRKNWDDLISEKKKNPTSLDVQTFEQKLAIFKATQAAELSAFKESQEDLKKIAHDRVVDSGADELTIKRADAGLEMDLFNNVYNFQLKQNEDLLKFTKGNVKAMTQAKADGAKLSADIAKKQTDFAISEDKREYDEYQKTIQDKKDADVALIESRMNDQLVAVAQAAKDAAAKNKSQYGFEIIDSRATIDSLKVTKKALEDLLDVENLTTDEIVNLEKNLADTKKAIQEAERADIEKTFKRRKELTKQAFDYGKETMDATFSIFSALQDAQMDRLEWQHDRDVNLAGDNVAKKLAAENKYDIEKRKIQRRQAILQKSQAAFNVIINTAEAIMATLGETGFFGLPLTPIIAGIGALQLGAVLAQAIPAYEEGGKHGGGLARFSEHGKQELFVPDIGKPFLTPKRETIANMPSGMFIPNDETQKILAMSAVNNFNEDSRIIDLNETNSLLRTISNKNEIIYSKGYKITNKNHIFGRYVTRN